MWSRSGDATVRGMTTARIRRPGALGAVLAVVAACVGVLVVAAAPASASLWYVANEAEYRSALSVASGDNTGPHTIELTADITLSGGTDPQYTGPRPLTIDGNDHVLSGGVARRILFHNTSASLTVHDIQMSNGKAPGGGAAIL